MADLNSNTTDEEIMGQSDLVSVEDLKRICRFEVTLSDLLHGKTFNYMGQAEKYQIVPEDLMEAVLNFQKSEISEEEFGNLYFRVLYDELYAFVGLSTAMEDPEGILKEEKYLPDQFTVFSNAWDILIRKYDCFEEDADLLEVVEEVRTWMENIDKPLMEREFSRLQKWDFINYWDDERLKTSEEDIKTLYRKMLNSLCEADDKEALQKKAGVCRIEENAVYKKDPDSSLKCLISLFELEPDPKTAEEIGDMYYHGYCGGGIPRYEKAFYYYSIGAMGGCTKSEYMLSDMFEYGYGTAKNRKLSLSILWGLYEKQIKVFSKGQLPKAFANVTLRLGDRLLEGPGPDSAYYYYLQAQFAALMGMITEKKETIERIGKMITEVLPKSSYKERQDTVHFSGLLPLLSFGLTNGRRMEMRILRISEKEAELKFRIVPFEYEQSAPKLLVTIPNAHYCGLLDELSVKAMDISTFKVDGDTDTLEFDSVAGDNLYMYSRKVAYIKADFIFTTPGI